MNEIKTLLPVFSVSETFEIITHESAEEGTFADSGFNFENEGYTLRELVDYIKRNSFVCPSQSHIKDLKDVEGPCRVWLSQIDGNIDYMTGESEFKNLHINNVSCRNFYRICRLAGINLNF